MEDKRFAVLIDAENISPKYISNILDEITKYGVITYKRAYGDWTSTHVTKWKNELIENSINPIQQFSNTIGKNASDSALIIDAMDILYTQNVEGFCIVSSDSDFTRLASRLRESGMDVIGMGENKTPRSFRAACSVFTNLELLLSADDDNDKENKSANTGNADKGTQSNATIDILTIERDVMSIISENANKDKETHLGEIGNRLLKKYPDFDVRNYGYSSLTKFVEEKIESVELVKLHNNVVARIKRVPKTEVFEFIMKTVKMAGKKGIELGLLGQKIHEQFKNFEVRDYGYSKFEKFVESVPDSVIVKDDAGRKKVRFQKSE